MLVKILGEETMDVNVAEGLEVRNAFGNIIGWFVPGAFFDMHQISIKYIEVLNHVKVHISLDTRMVTFVLTLKVMIDRFFCSESKKKKIRKKLFRGL